MTANMSPGKRNRDEAERVGLGVEPSDVILPARGGRGARLPRTLVASRLADEEDWEPPGGELFLHSEYYESDDPDSGLDGHWDDLESEVSEAASRGSAVEVWLSEHHEGTAAGTEISRDDLVRQVVALLGSRLTDAELIPVSNLPPEPPVDASAT